LEVANSVAIADYFSTTYKVWTSEKVLFLTKSDVCGHWKIN
ncbi:MAG: hypothetical protein ACJAVL_000165, partial [Bacteroidia bacterium]